MHLPNSLATCGMSVDVLKPLTSTNDSLLPTSMTLVDFGVALLRHKVGFDIFKQLALIAFERSEIVVATIDYQLTGFFEC